MHMKNDDFDQLWTLNKVAEYLDVDARTVRRLAGNGAIPAFKVGYQ